MLPDVAHDHSRIALRRKLNLIKCGDAHPEETNLVKIKVDPISSNLVDCLQ
jgi:hypothetical protein